MAKNPKNITIAVVVLAVIIVLAGYSSLKGVLSGSKLSSEEVAQKALDFINENMVAEGMSASLVDIVEAGDVYKMQIELGGTKYQLYVSNDGQYLFTEAYDMGTVPNASERPDVKLFVMSYCPYGLQAEKMYLPVYELLKGKADMGIYFVDYVMHEKKEIDENLRQYCMQKEQGDKYGEYLSCFVKDGNYESCLGEAGIDEATLDSCVSATDQQYSIYSQYEDESTWLNGAYPLFGVHSDLNKAYGVSGSPTVVINGEKVSVSPRSPENFKNIVCQAFTEQPEECSQTLSDEVFEAGFGMSAGSSSGGGCAE